MNCFSRVRHVLRRLLGAGINRGTALVDRFVVAEAELRDIIVMRVEHCLLTCVRV